MNSDIAFQSFLIMMICLLPVMLSKPIAKFKPIPPRDNKLCDIDAKIRATPISLNNKDDDLY